MDDSRWYPVKHQPYTRIKLYLGFPAARGEASAMNSLAFMLLMKFHDLLRREEGQDLTEYALVVALVAFGATAALKSLGAGLNSAFTQISSTLHSSLS
jgi:pilus assembly protein Flp/PilA